MRLHLKKSVAQVYTSTFNTFPAFFLHPFSRQRQCILLSLQYEMYIYTYRMGDGGGMEGDIDEIQELNEKYCDVGLFIKKKNMRTHLSSGVLYYSDYTST